LLEQHVLLLQLDQSNFLYSENSYFSGHGTFFLSLIDMGFQYKLESTCC